MDEPVYIPEKRKVRFKTNALDMVAGMTTGLWYHLICPHLELVDIIMLTRVCRAFVGNKSITTLLTQKRKAAFSKLNQRNWNKFGVCKSLKKIPDIKKDHAGKFMILDRRKNAKGYRMGAFSTKQRMITCLQENYGEQCHLLLSKMIRRYPGWAMRTFIFREISETPRIIRMDDLHIDCIGLTESEIIIAMGIY